MRRSRLRITREQLLDYLRTLAWVIPLTLLVWIWAEREQLARTPNAVSIPVTLRTTSPNLLVRMISPADQNVMAELSGPHNALDEVLKIISDPNSSDRVYINIDANIRPGTYEISADRIGQSTIFTGRGITVLNAAPSTITYTVEKIVEADFPVQMPADVTNLDGAPAFDPPTVKFHGPQSILDRLTADRQTVVYAELRGRDALRIPGPHEEKAVPLLLPSNDPDVSFTPTSVTATFKVRQAEERMIYPSMPVWVLAPPLLADRGYKVVLASSPNLENVTLVGSPDLIAQLRSGTIMPKPRAHVEVSLDDLPAGTPRTRQVKYDLPDGVRVSSDDVGRTVEFMLQGITPKE